MTLATEDQRGAASALSAFGGEIVNNDRARHSIRANCIGSPEGTPAISANRLNGSVDYRAGAIVECLVELSSTMARAK